MEPPIQAGRAACGRAVKAVTNIAAAIRIVRRNPSLERMMFSVPETGLRLDVGGGRADNARIEDAVSVSLPGTFYRPLLPGWA